MKYTQLGRTGLQVSRLCLGTMNFGPETAEINSHAIMDRALELGINFFDTANVYGRKIHAGFTEEIIGRWFSQGGGRREKVVLATKVYGKFNDWPNNGRLSAAHIRKACDDSLRRLQTDHIDLYQFHHIDRATPFEELWQACEVLVAQGKVTYFGSSNFGGWHIAKANEKAFNRHFLGLVSEQSLYNLKDRTIELEVIPAVRDYGMALLPWSPLAGGLLGGILEKGTSGRRANADNLAKLEKARPQIEKWETLCKEIGYLPADVALAWLFTNPVTTAPIIGPRTIEQLDQSLRAFEIDLNKELLQRLDQIFPGPGGEAPEAYSW